MASPRSMPLAGRLPTKYLLIRRPMSVSNVFFALVGLSLIVLTVLLVINETSRVHRRLESRSRPAPEARSSADDVRHRRRRPPPPPPPPTDPIVAAAVANSKLTSADVHPSDYEKAWIKWPSAENSIWTRQGGGGSASQRRRQQQQNYSRGWKILPGNVVVHEGDDIRVNPHDFNYSLNPGEALCAGLGTSSDDIDETGRRRRHRPNRQISVLVYVESEAKNVDRRRTIRETWALPMLQKAANFRVVFGLALPRSRPSAKNVSSPEMTPPPESDVSATILDEFYAYGDVVQEEFAEGFKRLALKSIMGLKWAKDYCRQADYVLKTDDDVLVHVPNLIDVLSDEERRSSTGDNLLLCHLNKNRQIVRRGISMLKYRVSAGELPGVFFPSYCGGFAYVMSRDVVVALYEASLTTPYFFIEDVYVTGFCRHKAGIVARDHEAIALKPQVTADRAPCDFSSSAERGGQGRRVTSQELDVEQMREIWRTLNTRGFFCPVPVVDRSVQRRIA